jgi:pyruvate/2-oxoglutarate dehydrogenase complex dihydrolipoamide dehydrogenase (E3) component
LKELPPRLAIVGAGPIGCEMSQAFARFGSRVVVYDKEPRILPADDLHPSEIVREALQREGVVFRLACTDLRLDASDREKRLSGRSAGEAFEDEFDEVLIASGRVPNVEDLNLNAAHVEYDESGVLVNDRLRTTNPRVYAAGDVCSQGKFTHAADAMARTVIANALFFGTQRISSALIPWCTYTDPEIARVGIGENDAHGKEYTVLDLPLQGSDRAVIDGQEEGLLRIYHDRHGRIHGATLVAAQAGEIIGELVVAMRHNVRLGALASDIHPYPTQSEIIKRAGDMYRRTLLTPTMAKMLKKFLEWRR